MSLAFARFMVHDVELLTPVTVTTRYGDTVPDWSQPAASTVTAKGWFVRTGTDEMADGREAITDLFELTLDMATPMTDDMRVVRNGVTYEIRGSVQLAEAPEGTHHQVAELRRVAG